MREVIVTKKYDNRKIDKFIMDSFGGIKYYELQKAFTERNVKLNGNRISGVCTVKTGDLVSLYIPDSILFGKDVYDIIYENDDFAIVNKYSGISTCDTESNEYDLTKILNERGTYYPCHRIDRNTGGLLVFAKNLETLTCMEEMIKNHEMTKKYICITVGHPPKKCGTVQSWIRKDEKNKCVYVYDKNVPGSKEAVMKYNTIGEYIDNAVLEIELVTGRMHQIRAQTAHMGCPLLGDSKYGAYSTNRKENVSRQMLVSERIEINGMVFELNREQIKKHFRKAGINNTDKIIFGENNA